MRLFLILLTLVALVLAVGGCNEKQLAKKQKELLEQLQKHAHAYNRMIVWVDFDGASAAVVPEKRIEFLEKSQEVAGRIRIEDFTMPLTQVSTRPFPRDESIPGQKAKEEAAKKYAPLDPTARPEVTPVEPAPETPAQIEQPVKKVKFVMPKVFYGVVLVRYINMTVKPSVTVRTRLIKQHWVYFNESWHCDADLDELLK
jgi:hypothetical protein